MNDEQSQNDEVPQGKKVTVQEALAFAIDQHRSGNLGLADEIYSQILEALPDHPDALHFHGVLLHQLGRSDEALPAMRRAIELNPNHPDFHINLGNVVTSLGRLEEGLQCYDRALELRPDNPDAHCNRGVVLRGLKRDREGAAAYRKALELDEQHAGAYHNMGNLLNDMGRTEDACKAYEKALELRQDMPEAFELAFKSQWRLGRRDAAIETLRKWLRLYPENPVAKHLLAAAEGKSVPSRAADDYVRQLFDNFARSFDVVLERLGYRAPALIAASLEDQTTPTGSLEVLDAGCGTGLTAQHLRPLARRLTGVDISPRMLDRARQTRLYDDLVEAELTTYLRSHPDRFELIASADTFCYFGDLNDLLAASAGALQPNGLLAFTVEKANTEEAPSGYALRFHGRYAHTREYVESQLSAAGLQLVRLAEDTLRKECGEPVHGFVVVTRRAASAN